jgi:squalene-hopene/tetraprenyl-beta-curcumene cyclase
VTGYRALLDDAHIRAVVRTALGAHGFAISPAEVAALVARRRAAGLRLRDRGFPSRLAPFLEAGAYEEVAEADAFLWERLPDMAGFGHQQALALGASEGGEAAELSAAFGTAVSLMDYLVDEYDAPVFEFVTPALVRSAFAGSDRRDAALTLAPAPTADPRMRLLVALVGACAAGFRRLFTETRDRVAWWDLREAVVALYDAERAVTSPGGARASGGDAIAATRAKSVLPFVAVGRILALAGERGPEAGDQASTALGEAVALADDLVDLAKDVHRGTANLLLLELAARLGEPGLDAAADTDVYEVVDTAATRLCSLLEPGVTGPGGERVLAFARATVGYWVGWEAEPGGPLERGGAPEDPLRRHAGAATRALLAEQSAGYGEAAHQLRVPRLEGDTVSIELHEGTLFQRAIALDALLDARDAGVPVPRRIVDAEAWTMLRAKRRDVPGGWSYLPDVPELPPDADDLAAVLRALVRTGGPALAAACNDPVDIALAGAEEGGAIPTWVLEPEARTDLERTMRAYVELTQSGGAHPDVVANLVSALVLLGEPRHREGVGRAVTYLEAAQDERGAWASRWYAGPYYGTYRAVSALALAAPSSPALDRAGAFLLSTRRDDGGWGAPESEPLATAFAAIALAHIQERRENESEIAAVLQEAASYQAGAQEPDGGWPACAFISFLRSDGATVHSYGSRTVTTAFCLQALLAVSRATAAAVRV